MKLYDQLLLENKAWAKEKLEEDASYFERLTEGQTPQFLWIGCSDSRVPPDVITQTQPGELFLHRNVANLVVESDLNLLSVVQYAVEVLQVRHVILCGHYGCGGVKSALAPAAPSGPVGQWIQHIKQVYARHRAELDALKSEEEQVNLLVEHNVREQLLNLARTSIIQQAWAQRQAPYLHGWVYGLSDGIIRPLLELDPSMPLAQAAPERRRQSA